MFRQSYRWGIVLGLALLVVACTNRATPVPAVVAVADAWARPAAASVTVASAEGEGHGHAEGDGMAGMEGETTSAVYLSLRNLGTEADTLTHIHADEVARVAELHQSQVDEQGVARMMPVERLAVPGGETITLEPGGYHIMLIGLKEALEPGDRFPVQLHFEQAGEVTVEVEVREP